MVTISDVMTKNYSAFRSDLNIVEVANCFLEKGLTLAVVVDDQSLPIGIIDTQSFLVPLIEQYNSNSPINTIVSKDFIMMNQNESTAKLLLHTSKTILVTNEIDEMVGFLTKTDLKRINGELSVNEPLVVKRLNQQLDKIIESSHDGIALTDAKGKILRINKSYSRICGVPWDVLKRHIGTYAGSLEKSWNSYQCGTPSNSLLVLDNKKPTTITQFLFKTKELKFSGNPVYNDDGEIEMVVWNIRDMTEIFDLKRQIRDKRNDRRHVKKMDYLTHFFDSDEVVVHSLEMKKVIETATRIASVDVTALITGETGVGKEVVVNIIHKNSSRRDGPLITVNCGAIPENLIESELFGYENGAFSGAKREGKIGLFETANNGTIFLDEIGDLPLLLQVKLLRVLQNHEIVRLGSTKPIKLDLRVIAATNKDLGKMVKENKFREDLFYRINVVPINIPPLRLRKLDVFPLAQHFIEKYGRKYNIKKHFSKEAFSSLEKYNWPGNVRELENIVERALIFSADEVILPHHIECYFECQDLQRDTSSVVSELFPLKTAKEVLERELIKKVVLSGLSSRKAASILQVDHTTIVRKINKYKKSI